MGPLEFRVIGFEDDAFVSEVLPQIEALREKGHIRVLEVLILKREELGDLRMLDLSDLGPDESARLSVRTGGEPSRLDTLSALAAEVPAGSSVAVLVLEHLWARPLQESIARSGCRHVAQGFLPQHAVEDLTEALSG